MTSQSIRRLRRRPLAVGLCALALWPTMASAQNWEVHSGLSPHRDRLRGVVDVRFCTGGGQASAGTQTVPAGTPGSDNLLVQRLDAANPTVTFWRNSYDSGLSETGAGIAEFRDGSGFAVVGVRNPLTSPAQTFLTISKVDCNGNMVWQNGYGPTAGRNVAWDIIRAETGDPALNTGPGHFIAIGEYTVNGVQYVRALRIRPNGALSWIREYVAPGGVALHARGIAEIDSTATGTDDLVIAGGVGNSAVVLQINGNTGLPVCAQQLPGLGSARFNDVAAHGGVGTIPPGYTVVGETSPPTGGSRQAFVASYRTLACTLQNQVEWGNPTDQESAQSVATTAATSFSTVPVGQLLIVGNVDGAFGGTPGSADVWSHLMTPITLAPYTAGGYTGQRYGTNGVALAGTEYVESLAMTPGGAYFVGTTLSNWTGAGDAQGYSVRMSVAAMKTQCSVPWKAPVAPLTPASALSVASTVVGPVVGFPPLPRSPIKADYCCGFALP